MLDLIDIGLDVLASEPVYFLMLVVLLLFLVRRLGNNNLLLVAPSDLPSLESDHLVLGLLFANAFVSI